MNFKTIYDSECLVDGFDVEQKDNLIVLLKQTTMFIITWKTKNTFLYKNWLLLTNLSNKRLDQRFLQANYST